LTKKTQIHVERNLLSLLGLDKNLGEASDFFEEWRKKACILAEFLYANAS